MRYHNWTQARKSARILEDVELYKCMHGLFTVDGKHVHIVKPTCELHFFSINKQRREATNCSAKVVKTSERKVSHATFAMFCDVLLHTELLSSYKIIKCDFFSTTKVLSNLKKCDIYNFWVLIQVTCLEPQKFTKTDRIGMKFGTVIVEVKGFILPWVSLCVA